MRAAYRADQVRAAEAGLLARDGDEPVMRRAARGLEVACARVLAGDRGRVTGARVVLLVGAGNNGGDALWAGAGLATRGARVEAVTLSAQVHDRGLAALLAAGGREVGADEGPGAIAACDLVVDGIVGIGGRGALRPEAAALARAALLSGARVVACDLPSGVDADTGAVADPDAVVRADLTVTFGALKPGLLVMPGAEYAGVVHPVDIGLGPFLGGVGAPVARVLQAHDVALLVPTPARTDHKYSRGVVVVLAGSAHYPGAGVLAVGAARHGGAGLVHYAGGAADPVVERYPDVVVGAGDDARATAHLVGPGLGSGAEVPDALTSEAPVVLDATALREVGAGGAWAEAVRARSDAGRITVLTPHDGELLALGGSAELLTTDRVQAAREVAQRWGAVVLLKVSGTVVAAPGGACWVNPDAPPSLATAGSGDVLAGLAASWLAAAGTVSDEAAAEVMAAAAWVHALAGRIAADGGVPVAALDLVDALPAAVAIVRGGVR